MINNNNDHPQIWIDEAAEINTTVSSRLNLRDATDFWTNENYSERNINQSFKEENFIWDKEAGFGDLFDDKLELADFYKEIRRADVDSKYKRMKVSEKYYDAQKTEIIK